ncbi:MAG: hypothetical protein JRJ85_17225 [Deltaproteobacteria bacterium]|nr:hypothetical protein [Deltaproteobacteria bacterium]
MGLKNGLESIGFFRPFSNILMVAVLACLFLINIFNVRRHLSQQVTLGYPSFLNAMNYLREKTNPDAILVGANYPQISWYADRRTVDFPGYDVSYQ